MKKLVIVIVVAAILVSMTGCASMLKSMGAALETNESQRDAALKAQVEELRNSTAALKAETAEIANLKQQLLDIVTQMEETKAAAANVEKVSALVEELRVQVDTLPQATLRQLIDILTQALQ